MGGKNDRKLNGEKGSGGYGLQLLLGTGDGELRVKRPGLKGFLGVSSMAEI